MIMTKKVVKKIITVIIIIIIIIIICKMLPMQVFSIFVLLHVYSVKTLLSVCILWANSVSHQYSKPPPAGK